MGLKVIEGDVINALIIGDIDIFAHGVNCLGGFGSGIAGQIARRLPNVRDMYRNKHETEGWGLGQVQLAHDNVMDPNGSLPKKVHVLNCATQYSCGGSPKDEPYGMYANYGAIHQVMYEYHDICKANNWIPGLPYIGCGLAGGEWDVVEQIVDKIFHDMTLVVYKYVP